jgi:hypothetical protein
MKSEVTSAQSVVTCIVCEENPAVVADLCKSCLLLRRRGERYVLPDGSCVVPWPCAHSHVDDA